MEAKNDAHHLEVESEEFSSIEKVGIMPNIDIKKTILQNLKRNAAQGEAKVGNFKKDDIRYRTWDDEKIYHSNAAVYLMMDRSGSMDDKRTKIAKTFYFWLVQFLRRKYKHVQLVFIAHDYEAFIVEEEEFFKISADGGTQCSSAFRLAYEHMLANHPPERWNNYVFEFSDGDNWGNDNYKCVEYVKKMLPMTRAMGYGEILLEDRLGWQTSEGLLSNIFEKELNSSKFASFLFFT
jgi:hypothetical protein